MPLRARTTAALLAACLACLGCPGKPEGNGDQRARKQGIRIALPDTWTAQVGPDQGLRVGPAGRVVLKIDWKAGQGDALPSAQALRETLTRELAGGELKTRELSAKPGRVVLRVDWMVPADGGVEVVPLSVGAKRIGDDLLLCSTVAGATEDEVKRAARACEGLSLGVNAPPPT